MQFRKLWFARIVLAVLLVIALSVRVSWLSTNIPSAQVLWNDREIYVFVDENNVLWSGNLLRSAIGEIKTSLTAVPPPTKQVFVCKAFVWTNGGLEAHEIRDFQCASTLAPYRGRVHAFVGGRNEGVWRWTGSSFVKLDAADEKTALGSFRLRTELFQREHWSQDWLFYPFAGTEKMLDIPLRDGTVKLVSKHEGNSLVISLKSSAQAQPVLVYRGEDKKGYISQKEAKRLLQ